MNTHITNIKGDWQEVVDTCRATSGKGPLGHEPSEDFKRRILIAEHSPIRRISVSWVWQGIKSWIATHWSRHKAALYEIQPEISDVLVPNCIYRCGCPEMQTCGLYESWSRLRPEVMSTYIQHRYDIYNSMFWKARAKRGNDSGD